MRRATLSAARETAGDEAHAEAEGFGGFDQRTAMTSLEHRGRFDGPRVKSCVPTEVMEVESVLA